MDKPVTLRHVIFFFAAWSVLDSEVISTIIIELMK